MPQPPACPDSDASASDEALKREWLWAGLLLVIGCWLDFRHASGPLARFGDSLVIAAIFAFLSPVVRRALARDK